MSSIFICKYLCSWQIIWHYAIDKTQTIYTPSQCAIWCDCLLSKLFAYALSWVEVKKINIDLKEFKKKILWIEFPFFVCGICCFCLDLVVNGSTMARISLWTLYSKNIWNFFFFFFFFVVVQCIVLRKRALHTSTKTTVLVSSKSQFRI